MPGQMWHGRRKKPEIRFRVRRRFPVSLLLLTFSLVLLAFSVPQLVRYHRDYALSRRTSQELQQDFHALPEDVQTVTESALPVPASPSPAPAATSTSSRVAHPMFTPVPTLPPITYPGNSALIVDERFRSLRRKNKDIVGWLNIAGLLDEAVVQRDEEYYMTHDALGNKSSNGAIFMDSYTSLKTRPYTVILFGHNMKSGTMFGCLRNYENFTFYQKNPFVSFSSLYESAEYIVFSVGTINTIQGGRNAVNYFDMVSLKPSERQHAIDQMIQISSYTCTIDVKPDDQFLILMTCADRDTDRRIVACRRVRSGEDREKLLESFMHSRKK